MKIFASWLTARRVFFGLVIAVLLYIGLACVLCMGIWFRQWDGSIIRMLVQIVPVPAARVDRTFISYRTYLIHADAERRFLQGPTAREQRLPLEPTPDMRARILERAIRMASVERFASDRGVVVTDQEVNREYLGLIARAGTSTTAEEFEALLQTEFGWNADMFKQYVIKPAMTEDALAKQAVDQKTQNMAFEEDLDIWMRSSKVVRYLRF